MTRLINLGVFGLAGRGAPSFSFDTGGPMVATPGIERTQTPSVVDEDASNITVSFRLRTQPSGDVTVTIESSDTSALNTVATDSRDFTTSNWDTAQSLTLDPVDDTDFDDESVTVTLTSTSTADTDYDGLTSTFSVTVVDVDIPPMGITRTVTPSTVTEPGTATVSFHLDSQPSGTVTVEGSTDDSSSLTFSPSSFVTFSATDWNTAKSLTLSAIADVDADDETVAVTLTAGSNYGSVTSTFNVTVTDDDAAGAISLTSNDTTLTEGGSNGTVVFSLSAQPTETVTVTGSISDTGAVAFVGATSRDFTTSNWNSTQTLTYGPVDDTDATNESVTLTLTASGAQYDGLTSSYTVTVADDDATGTIVVTAFDTTIDEGDSSTISFRLSAQPSSDVVVATAAASYAYVSIPGTRTNTFTTANWNTAQSQTIDADNPITEDQTVVINLTASGGGYDGVTATRTLTIENVGLPSTMWMVGTNTDALFTMNFLPAGVSATQVGSSTQFGQSIAQPNSLAYHEGVLYMAEPIGDNIYTLNASTGVATLLGSLGSANLAPTGLASQGGVLYLSNNAPDTIDKLYTVNTSTGALTSAGPDDFGVGESTPRGLCSDGTTMYMMGWDNDQLYTVNPDTGIAVLIGTLGPQRPGLQAVDALSFHEGVLYGARANAAGNNYSASRLVSINTSTGAWAAVTTANNFGISEGAPKGMASNQRLASGASGGAYMGFVPTNLPSTVTEGSTATFNVALNASPTEGNTVTVTTVSNHPNAMTVTTGASLTFDTSNWSTAQDVILTATGGGGKQGAQILLSASGGGFDDNVMQFFPEVTPIDDSLIVGGASKWIRESGTGSFRVKLSSLPTGDVTVSTVSANSNKVYITAGATHTFTTSNWDDLHTIDVYGYADSPDAEHEHVDLTLTASGGGNSATAVRTIHIYDDD